MPNRYAERLRVSVTTPQSQHLKRRQHATKLPLAVYIRQLIDADMALHQTIPCPPAADPVAWSNDNYAAWLQMTARLIGVDWLSEDQKRAAVECWSQYRQSHTNRSQ